MNKLLEMEKLIKELTQYSKEYYLESQSSVSDKEYDEKYDRLLKLEEDTGCQYFNSPTVNVGYETVDSLNKVTHVKKMLSLNKTKDLEVFKNFLKEKNAQEGILSWKLDGITIVLEYENGYLQKAVTRGNGVYGEDVTHNVKMFTNLPNKISFKDKLIIRGEAVINYDSFDKINEKLDNKYKNPRNLISGTIRQLSNEALINREIHFYAFELINYEDFNFVSKSKTLNFLEDLGFEIVAYCLTEESEEDISIEDIVMSLKNNIKHNNFPSDGLVLTVNNIKAAKALGETSKFPKDSLALKWEDETEETTLVDIEWNVSRTGLINPIAIFKPVELEGTTISRASIHNVSILKELELGLGDKILVYKANMIIPQIYKNLTRSNNLEIPEFCPICGESTVQVKENNSIVLKCINKNCSAQILSKLVHFCSREAMNIKGLSKETLNKIVKINLIDEVTDIYKLFQYESELCDIDRLGNKSVKNILNNIERSKNVNLPNFLYALGIEGVGLVNAKLICNSFNNDLDYIMKASYEDFLNIKGIGETMANSLSKFFLDENNIRIIEDFKQFLNFSFVDNAAIKNSSFKELRFCVHGKLELFKNRQEIIDSIERNGGTFSNSISKKTDYLISNEKIPNNVKVKKAIENDIPIISESEFLILLKN